MKPSAPLLLFDVNVILDLLLDREPWSEPAAALLSLCDRRLVLGSWCAASVGTVHFLVKRELGAQRAREVVSDLARILRVLPVDESVIGEAINGNWPDLEDAIIHAAGRQAGATHLVTRNPRDFRRGSLDICAPDSLLLSLTSDR